MDPDQFERHFIDMVVKIGTSKGMNHSAVSRAAFGDTDTSVVRWRQIRNVRKATGKAQNLTIDDAVRLSRALDEEFPSLCFKAWETMLSRVHEVVF